VRGVATQLARAIEALPEAERNALAAQLADPVVDAMRPPDVRSAPGAQTRVADPRQMQACSAGAELLAISPPPPCSTE